MKLAVSSTGQELTSQVNPRFGRSPYLVFIDTETMQPESVENPNVNAMGGAGIQTAQFVANKGVEFVLTGSCGPNAFQTLQAAGVKLITGVVGSVEEVVNKFKSGQYKATSGPNVTSHNGMDIGLSFNSGSFFKMGHGMRRGLCGGMGVQSIQPSSMPSAGVPQPAPEEELQMLKQQMEFLKQQLDMISARIRELEKNK